MCAIASSGQAPKRYILGGVGKAPAAGHHPTLSSITQPERSVFRLKCSETEQRRRHTSLHRFPLLMRGRPFVKHCKACSA